MIPQGKSNILHLIISLIVGLMLAMLLTETLSINLIDQYRTSFQLIHFVLAILLIISLYLQFITFKRTREIEKTNFRLEKLEMQRAGENTAIRYRNLLECAGDAIFVINAENGQLQEMNGKGSELFGYSREEMERLNGRDLVPLPDQQTYLSLVKRIIRHGTANGECVNFVNKSGNHFLGEVNARLIDLGDEKVVQAIVRDITQKKHAEMEILTRNRKLSILNTLITKINQSIDLDSVLDMALHETMDLFGAEGGMIHLQADEKLVLVARKSFLGPVTAISESDLPAPKHHCLMTANLQCISFTDGPEATCAIFDSARKTGWRSAAGIPLSVGEKVIGVMHLLSRSEKEYLVDDLGFLSTLGNQIGMGIEHAGMFEELKTKSNDLLRSHRLLENNSRQLELSQRKLTKNLKLVEQANRELERLDKMKSHFIGMISHEFKTPLTSIMSGTEFLISAEEKGRFEEVRKIADMIHSSGVRLNETVSQLIKVARLETDRQSVSDNVLRLHDVLDCVREGFDAVLEERRHCFVMSGVESVPLFYGNKDFLVEIFTQLVGNAVKFTPDGGEIAITASIVDRQRLEDKAHLLERFNSRFFTQMGCKCYLQVEIRDSGIGIEVEEQAKIFDKFYELGDIRHHSTSRHKYLGKGTGMGLAIVKGMVEAHSGMVWVESPADRQANLTTLPGSAFFLLLPLEEDTSQSVFPFMDTPGSTLSDIQDTDEQEMT